MATPQQISSAPDKYCPKCGRRMQLLSVSPSTYSYVCYAHSTQNSTGPEPFYVNVHYRIKYDEKGRIAVMDEPKRSKV